MPAAAGAFAQDNDELLAMEDIRIRLRANSQALLGLFQNGRTVQPTDNVIRFMAPLVLDQPVDSRDVGLLSEILDPNSTKFVVLKRVKDLVGAAAAAATPTTTRPPPSSQQSFHSAADTSLVLVSTTSRQQLAVAAPPKRAPPPAPSSAASILSKQARHQDPDKLAIMTALTWSGKHLAHNAVQRFDAPVTVPPLSRFIRPIDQDQLAYTFQDQDLSVMHHYLSRQVHDARDRGKLCIALVAAHVLGETTLRNNTLGSGENAQLVQAIVPRQLLHSFLTTHRMHRQRVLEDKSHELFLSLSAVRLPLAVTALRVEMDSAARHVAAFVLSYNHFGRGALPVWLSLTDKQRSAFATSMWELRVWDDELWRKLCGEDEDGDGDCDALLEVLLLPRQLQLANGGDGSEDEGAWEGKTEMEAKLHALQEEMDAIEASYKQPSSSDAAATQDLSSLLPESDLDVQVRALKTRVHEICGEVWL